MSVGVIVCMFVCVSVCLGQQVFDYNTLESAFLISATFMLLGGLIFKSVADAKGTPAYVFLTAFVAILFIFSLVLFLGLLSYEMYQALKFAHVLQYVPCPWCLCLLLASDTATPPVCAPTLFFLARVCLAVAAC
jgi:hypothetical protein